jgi:hypothetical protein
VGYARTQGVVEGFGGGVDEGGVEWRFLSGFAKSIEVDLFLAGGSELVDNRGARGGISDTRAEVKLPRDDSIEDLLHRVLSRCVRPVSIRDDL